MYVFFFSFFRKIHGLLHLFSRKYHREDSAIVSSLLSNVCCRVLSAGVFKVFTHLRCRDLPINHCNSACPAPSRAIRVRICISDYTERAERNGPRV